MCRDSFRYCLNCEEVRRFHKSWGYNHSICKQCGMPSLFAVKMPLSPEKIEERREELRFMMGGRLPSYV